MGNFHFGLFHKPIPILEAMKIPRAKAAYNEGCNMLKRLLVWDEKKVKPKLVVVRRAMEGGETIHFEDDRPWSFFRTQNSHGTCKNTKGVQCSVWMVLRTSADTGPCSQSKVLQRHRWQRQKFLDTVSRFPSASGQASDAVFQHTVKPGWSALPGGLNRHVVWMCRWQRCTEI